MFYIVVLYFIFVDNTHIGNEDERLIFFERERKTEYFVMKIMKMNL